MRIQAWRWKCESLSCVQLSATPQTVARQALLSMEFSRWSSQPRDRTHVSCMADRIFTIWAIRQIMCITPENMPFILLGLKLMENQNKEATILVRNHIYREWKKRKIRTSFRVQEEEIYSSLRLPPSLGPHSGVPSGCRDLGFWWGGA